MNSSLRRREDLGLRVLDLYCGAGGFSLGFWAAGFDVEGIDWNHDAAATYSANMGRASCENLIEIEEWPNADVIVAGPPCQPWSRAGKRLGGRDERDGFDIVKQFVENVNPFAVVVENVPDVARMGNRHVLDSFISDLEALGYRIAEYVLNAADFAVPQDRRRIFVTGVLDQEPLSLPEGRPGKVSVRQAIPGRHRRAARGSQIVSESMISYIRRYEQASGCRIPRDVHPDRPCRTLTVRNLSGATGDMLRILLPDGSRRTLTVQEAARLQSFPDWFKFRGSERTKFEQIGNAVPPLLSLAIANTVKERITQHGGGEFLRTDYPDPSTTAASATMRANRRRDTGPERRLRSALHGSGLRFRVDLPIETKERRVRPDIVFARKRVAVFVDGCFWHGCDKHRTWPKANSWYWESKIEGNIHRDQEDSRLLEQLGWKVVRIWEHDTVSDAVAVIRKELGSI